MGKLYLDLRQFTCPLPLLITDKTVSQLEKGDKLHIKLNPQNSLEDLRLLCQQKGYQLIDCESDFVVIQK